MSDLDRLDEALEQRIYGLEVRVEALEWLFTDEQLVDAHRAIRTPTTEEER